MRVGLFYSLCKLRLQIVLNADHSKLPLALL